MKFLALFMAVLFLGLCFMPCADAVPKNKEQLHKIVQDEPHSDEHYNDQCSPLCVCHCCNTSTVYQEEIQLSLEIPLTFMKEKSGYILPEIFKIHYAIWQPPQLVG